MRTLNDAPVRDGAEYVLYWAQMNRRVDSNHALAWAIQRADELRLPVLYYEGLTCTYKEANDRLHTFILEGAPETERRLARLGIGYCFYLRRRRDDPNDVFYRLAERAACVVTDDYPTFIAAVHNESVPGKIRVSFQAVDSSCVVPMNALEKREYAAYTIRPKITKMLPDCLEPCVVRKPARAWGGTTPEWHLSVGAGDIPALVASCQIDHSVPPSISYTGGRLAAEKLLKHFLEKNLRRYARERNEPTAHATSDMSPYLHFGQISSLEIALAASAYAKEHDLIASEFLEELIVRRELAFNYARHVEHPDSLCNLPDWAKATLRKHAADARSPCYTTRQFEHAETHDALWNACQTEMLLRGKIHGYYRMYWGKKIIEWSRTCQDALETMIFIHDRYALDGRDPNTYTNILWCFGLHDRPWQERPIFGMIRYMNLAGMKRKTGVDAYLREIAHLQQTGEDPFRVH
ncbi:deoxyribodipyrimidine photo-lyase [uncultured Paludibaculum sp.]|uniref:deoxyribodipyrimidine photo-lyase n=1 Tax=uncultured Paludibaculum sp. TaxID=1765020 RepID=UPI002AAB5BEB|nr:deoxyribodipyrimidine photo-lyase [uncultured Paludibaculum sp.]